jgi:proteasome lid subunit RPN8/RPN11
VIRLSSDQVESIRDHGGAEFPRECCGALLGDVDGDVKVVREVRPLPNTFEPSAEFERSAGDPSKASDAPVGRERRYMVSPEAMFQLMRYERQSGRKVLGFYHSHPDHPARPSEYDRAWAMPWYSYLIVSVLSGRPDELTAWLLSDDGTKFEPESLDSG